MMAAGASTVCSEECLDALLVEGETAVSQHASTHTAAQHAFRDKLANLHDYSLLLSKLRDRLNWYRQLRVTFDIPPPYTTVHHVGALTAALIVDGVPFIEVAMTLIKLCAGERVQTDRYANRAVYRQ